MHKKHFPVCLSAKIEFILIVPPDKMLDSWLRNGRLTNCLNKHILHSICVPRLDCRAQPAEAAVAAITFSRVY